MAKTGVTNVLACKKADTCPYWDKCSKSPFGRCIYTKLDWDAWI